MLIGAKLRMTYKKKYENVMTEYLDSITVPNVLHGYHLCSNTDHIFLIEKYYNDLIDCIKSADTCLPRCKPTVQKQYWNENLNILKNDSIVAHDFWKLSNCPRSGPIFEAKKDSHYKYKLYLRKCRNDFNQSDEDKLNADLANGNMNKFWKSYKYFNNWKKVELCNSTF